MAANVLTKAAIDRGSKDNVTVVIVDLKPGPPPQQGASSTAEDPSPTSSLPATDGGEEDNGGAAANGGANATQLYGSLLESFLRDPE